MQQQQDANLNLMNVPSAQEMQNRKAFYRRIQRLIARKGASAPGPSTEALLRQDRER